MRSFLIAIMVAAFPDYATAGDPAVDVCRDVIAHAWLQQEPHYKLVRESIIGNQVEVAYRKPVQNVDISWRCKFVLNAAQASWELYSRPESELEPCKRRIDEAIARGVIREMKDIRPGNKNLMACRMAIDGKARFEAAKSKMTSEAAAAGRYPIRINDTALRQP